MMMERWLLHQWRFLSYVYVHGMDRQHGIGVPLMCSANVHGFLKLGTESVHVRRRCCTK
jgi:hypothetical protein